MSEDERVVREAWVKVSFVNHETCSPSVYIAPFEYDGWRCKTCIYMHTPEEAWSAARKFTDEHAEKIRQVREEIKWLFNAPDCSEKNRIFSRLEAALNEMLKGWRQ